MTAAQSLPLFLLNVVLFPKMALPLRVFEPRYRKLVEHCMQSDGIFGVLLIRAGQEVGGPAEPYSVGTTARIEEVEKLADGTLMIHVVGVQRFRLLEVLQAQPFRMGRVEYLTEEAGSPGPELVEALKGTAERYLRRMLALSGEWARRIDLRGSPEDLSYGVPARMPSDQAAKQQILETPDVETRLKRTLRLLATEEEVLEQRIAERMWLRSDSLN